MSNLAQRISAARDRSGRDPGRMAVAITGGARGIGRATAERLARAGARVAIGDLDEDLVQRTATEINEALGRTDAVVAAPLDVTSSESWNNFLAATEAVGPLDGLVNNAGIMPLSSVLKETEEMARAIVDVNLHGLIHGTKAVVPGMAERGHGHIVNVASAVGRLALPAGATYSASKFAAVGFSEATREELRPMGIDVSMVLPTVVLTELAAGVPPARGIKPVTADDVAAVIETALRRPTPEMWVPRWSQGLSKATQVLPRRVQGWATKALKADSVLAEADPAARASYEARIRRQG